MFSALYDDQQEVILDFSQIYSCNPRILERRVHTIKIKLNLLVKN